MQDFVAHIKHPKLRHLFHYWLERCRNDRLPRRSDIDPTDMPQLLSSIYLIDVEKDPLRFRYRLVGSDIERTLGRKLVHRYLDEALSGELRHVAVADMEIVHRSSSALVRWGTLTAHNVPYMDYLRLALPLADEDNDVNMILCGIHYEWITAGYKTLDEVGRYTSKKYGAPAIWQRHQFASFSPLQVEAAQ